MIYDAMYFPKDPKKYIGDIFKAKHESEMNAILDVYQGDFYGVGYNETRGDINLTLEAAGIIPAGKPARHTPGSGG
jgi:hypothetical protein